jgi:hypothetical protein
MNTVTSSSFLVRHGMNATDCGTGVKWIPHCVQSMMSGRRLED